MSDIKFMYAIKPATQLSFTGHEYEEDVPVGDCHIAYQGSAFCKTDRDKLLRKHEAKKVVVLKNRPKGIEMCKKCEQAYKLNGQLEWSKWEKSVRAT